MKIVTVVGGRPLFIRCATVYVSFAGIQLRVPTFNLKEMRQVSEDLLKGRKPFDPRGCGLNLIEWARFFEARYE